MLRTLVLPPRLTASAERVREAAERRGLGTEQLPASEVPDGLAAHHVHAGPTFADAVTPVLGLVCLEAPVTWLADLPRGVVGREIVAMPIRDAWALRYPGFVKAPNDKSFRAMVYSDGTRPRRQAPPPEGHPTGQRRTAADAARRLKDVRAGQPPFGEIVRPSGPQDQMS